MCTCESQSERWPIRRWSVHRDLPLCSLHSWESSREDQVSSHPETSSSGRQLCTRGSLRKLPRGAWNSTQIKKYVEENSSSSEKQVRKLETQKQTEARMKASLPPATNRPALTSASHLALTGKFTAKTRRLALSPGSLVLPGAVTKVNAA